MNEKVIIKSEKDKVLSNILKVIMLVGAVIFVVSLLQMMELFELYPWYWDPWPTIISIAIVIIAVIIFCITMTCDIIVTDKRVYGKAGFGKRVDLPIDSISAVGTSVFKGLTVATSSGRISFVAIKNRDEIHKEISKLLVERQKQNTTPAQTAVPTSTTSNADELKKYKELLDSGVITQEEFDAKKKQLLGL